MPNPKLETLTDSFTGSSINTTLWNNITAGSATLDTVNDLVTLAVPTASGGINTFGTNTLYDATGSSVYAQVGVAANGNGNTKTIMRVRFDSNNAATMRVESGVFKLTMQIGGTLTSTTLPAYDPNAHRWWRLRESGGSFYADTSPDGLTWTQQASMAYTWDATNVTLRFESQASATEAAGNVSVIAGVNTRLGGQYNPNWPQIEYAWAPYWNCNGGDLPLDRYVDVTDRTRGTVGLNRGRQYELDQVRSSDLSVQLANTDGALDPNNAAGPWYGHIQPYQPYRVRAQWPPTRNLVTQVQATGGDLGGYSTGVIPGGASGIDVFSLADSSGGTITASSSAWQGSSVFQFSVPSGTATQTAICYTAQPAVQPGITYTVQMQVRNVTAATTLQVDAFIVFSSATGVISTLRSSVVTLTGSATAGWTLVTVTGTAPANTARVSFGVETGGAAAATCSVQVDGWQWERSSAASTWTCPGTVYPVFGGFVERWPSSWAMSGTYGTVQPTAVDALSLLSQVQLDDPLTEEINSHSPRFLYTLGDPQGSGTFTDSTGQNPAAAAQTGKYGPGSLAAGTQITSATSGGAYTGSSNTVVTINNPNPGTNLISGATFISLSSAGIKGPADPTQWTRMIAFRYTGPTPSSGAYLWSSMDSQRGSSGPSGSHIYVYLDSSGKPNVWIQGPSGAGLSYQCGGATNCADSNWHLLLVGYSQSLQQVLASQDGATVAYYTGVPTTYTPTGLVSDNVGGFVDATVGNGTTQNYKGDISFVAEWPTLFGSSQITNLYNAWKTSCSGESTDARYNRILRYAGYTGLSSVQTGLTTSMGPAALGGQDALSALQAVVDTESGEHFVARDGTLTFKSRSARYNSLTPSLVFGENTSAGEIPYEDCALDYDPTHLSNLVTVTQASTNQTFVAQDSTSQTNYFPRTLTRTVNSSSALECQDAAGYLLSRYKNALTRVQSLKVHPSANPALWPTLLGLELGTRGRVMRRPPSPAPAIQVECYVEGIQWDWDNQGEAFVTLQCSPADLTPYAIFAAFHTTLSGSPAAGVPSIVINAGSDNTNPAAAQLGQGQQLILGLGTTNQETVTIQSVSTTSPGWTTATITLQAATTKSHTSGDTVCEPLPSGITSATTWDNTSKFDTAAFAY